MLIPAVAVIIGLILLLFSADRFVEGSASVARYYRVPPLLIGMLIVGFGTSAPELIVSTFSAAQGNSGIALGKAYGSNITNIALIIGLTALINPVAVHSLVLKKELPILTAMTVLAVWQLWDGQVSRFDAGIRFSVLVIWSIWQGMQRQRDPLGSQMDQELHQRSMPIGRSLFWLILGLLILIASSRMLVWGAVEIANLLGVSELVIGLTVVAVGTSLPELASSVIASRKGEHDIALGNILGSNLFNTMAVIGIAAMVQPLTVPPEVLSRDLLLMFLLTISLFAICFGFKGRIGRVNRIEELIALKGYCY